MTLRELIWAAEARQQAEWERASTVIATIWNTSPHRTAKSRFWVPEDFNPFTAGKRRESQPEIETAEQLWSAFGLKPEEPC